MDQMSGIGGSTDFDNITSFSMDPDDRGRDYGRAAFDIRHYMTVNSSYELPEGAWTGVADRVLNGWKLSGLFNYSSGEPFTVVNSFDRAGNNTRIFGNQERPNVAPAMSNNPVEGATAGCTLGSGNGARVIPAGQKLGTPEMWFDPCAFQLQPAGLLGNLGRNTLQSPNLLLMNLAILKNFAVSESNHLEFRWEMFNLFNRVNFSGPTSTLFSNATAVNEEAATITQTEGTARQMQFALKYVF
jgi:hypothetical protein